MTERLALFPLDTVLVPGMVLPLHIFERRYQIMMRHVLAGNRRFGVLLLRRGNELDPDPEPYDIGTIAEVTDVVPLEGGRMNISTTGRQRFRVVAFHHDQPYLSADIDVLADGYQATEQLLELQEEVERLGLRYVTMMLTLTHEQITHVQLPSSSARCTLRKHSNFWRAPPSSTASTPRSSCCGVSWLLCSA